MVVLRSGGRSVSRLERPEAPSVGAPRGEAWRETAPAGAARSWTLESIIAAAAARPGVLLLALACYALAFQGSRALWEPDEGRYTAVALEMQRLGDYLLPHLNHESIHLAKPPLTYWLLAASIQVFGRTEWAARLPNALAFIATVIVVAGLSRRLAPSAVLPGPLVYAGALLPVAAANVIGADTLLTLWETLAVYGFVELVWGPADRLSRNRHLMWLAFGLAFLTKGPPGLIPLFPILLFTVTTGGWRATRRLLSMSSALVFAIVGLSWYLVIVATTPGALDLLLRREVFDRIFTGTLDRNSGWLGPLRAYLPVVVLGWLPWAPEVAAGVRGARQWVSRRWWRERRALDHAGWFLSLWLAAPLVVFVAARSRMPLYLLPLAVPASLLIARSSSIRSASRRRAIALLLWIVVVVLGRGALALKSSSKDARSLARAIGASMPSPIDEVVFVETVARYGLALYLDAEVERVSLYPQPAQAIETPAYEPLAHELTENEGRRVLVVSSEDLESFHQTMARLGRGVEKRGGWQKLSFFRLTE
jgi:4-amino-4-deoxy-L-arabinose transferase